MPAKTRPTDHESSQSRTSWTSGASYATCVAASAARRRRPRASSSSSHGIVVLRMSLVKDALLASQLGAQPSGCLAEGPRHRTDLAGVSNRLSRLFGGRSGPVDVVLLTRHPRPPALPCSPRSRTPSRRRPPLTSASSSLQRRCSPRKASRSASRLTRGSVSQGVGVREGRFAYREQQDYTSVCLTLAFG